jgi:hypothetical protein
MTEHRRQKAAGDMAQTAITGSGQMVYALAKRGDSVVTRSTVVHNTGVIHHRSGKSSGTMTVGAVLGSGHMIHRLVNGH